MNTVQRLDKFPPVFPIPVPQAGDAIGHALRKSFAAETAVPHELAALLVGIDDAVKVGTRPR